MSNSAAQSFETLLKSLVKPYRATLDHGLICTRLGNPLGRAELAASGRSGPSATPRVR
jgi:hypothetical protein